MNKYLDKEWLIILIIILLGVLLRLPSLDEPFENDSGANAYHARLIINGEPLYGTHHPSHHLPAVYYNYALAFFILGDSTLSIKFLLIPWTIATALLIFLIGKRLENKKIGLLSAIFFVFLSSHVFLEATSARAETFANLPITAAFLLTIEMSLRGSKNWKFALIGVLSAISFLYKPGFIFILILTSLILLVNAWLFREKQSSWRTATLRIVFILVGFIASILSVLGYFASQGLLSRFFLIFTLGQKYLNNMNAPLPLIAVAIAPLYILAINNIFLLVLCLVGCMRLLRQVLYKHQMRHFFILTGVGTVLWLIFSIGAAGITRRAWPYYSVIILPPLAIIATWEIGQLQKIFSRWMDSRGYRITWIPVTLLLVAILLFSGVKNYIQYYHYMLFKLGDETYQEFLNNSFPFYAETYIKVGNIADYIISHTNPDDLIYYWSNEAQSNDVQLYYLTNRRSPIDMIWPLYSNASGPYSRIFSTHTKYIVVNEDVLTNIPVWLLDELDKSYHLEAVIAGHSIYRRNDH